MVLGIQEFTRDMFSSKQADHSTPPLLISKYLHSKLVIQLSSHERDGALHELVNLLDREGNLIDKELFYQALLERERIVSTGIGMGVAVPHAKLSGYTTFFIAIGIHQRGIAWDTLDGFPVRLIFLIGGPDDRQTEYLQLLSRLTLAIKDEERRKKILQLNKAEDIIELFSGL